MLKPTEAIGKIKELLGLEFADTKKEKFYTSSLADGTPITNNTDSEKLELGDTLYVVLEDGNLVPAPAGEHTLQSGEVIMLDEESKVVEIREDREEDVPDEVDVVVEQKEIEEEMSSDTELVALKNEISEMKEALSKVLDLFQDFSTQTEEEFSKVISDIDTLKKEPEVENIKNKTKNNKLVVENFADYRVQQLKKYFN